MRLTAACVVRRGVCGASQEELRQHGVTGWWGRKVLSGCLEEKRAFRVKMLLSGMVANKMRDARCDSGTGALCVLCF